MAFFGFAGSTVHGLLRHHVQGVPATHFNVRLPCANCLSANWEYTVRMPLASMLGLTVSHATVARFGPSSTSQVQIATFGLPGCGMHGAGVQRAKCCWQKKFSARARTAKPRAARATTSRIRRLEFIDDSGPISLSAFRGLASPVSAGHVKEPDSLCMRPVERTNRLRGGLQQNLAALLREISLGFRREMHIAHLARAENELLASPLEDELRFVFREHVRGAAVPL